MVRIVVGIFSVLHGLVHLLYMGQSWRFFQMKPGMTWPDGSWAFSKLVGDGATRSIAGIACILAAIGFLAGGAGVFLEKAWRVPAIAAASALSTLLYLLFWNGKLQNLDGQGAIGILLSLAILGAVLAMR